MPYSRRTQRSKVTLVHFCDSTRSRGASVWSLRQIDETYVTVWFQRWNINLNQIHLLTLLM